MKRLRLGIQLAICLLVSLMLLLCGCSRTETREIPASSAPETVQATPESVKKNTSLTPQEELEDHTVPYLRRNRSEGNTCKF